MTHKSLLVALAAAMVLLAGCTGSLSGAPGDGDVAGDTGTVNFYVSDEPNAIEDFEHLNVTITKVGFQQAGDDGEMDENETETPDEDTETPDEETETPENETESPDDETDAPEDDSEAEESEDDAEDAEDDADEGEDDADESGGWTEYDVDNRTVDLTELRGANSTLIGQFNISEGDYTKVFVHVGEINATLTTGESVNVKLPSEKLQINKQFQVENGSEVDFVFDIAVHKAGNSGKYILKPVISQSGTDVPIEDVDADDEDEREDDESDLEAGFVGNVTQGEDATVEVTSDGEAVENATVYVNDADVGMTDADGRLTFEVPDGEELEVEVKSGEAEAELEREFESEDDAPNASPTPAAEA